MPSIPEVLQSTAQRLALLPEQAQTPRSEPPGQLRSAYAARQRRHWRLLLAVQLLYACLFAGWLFYNHTWPEPDVIALFLLFFAFLAARGLSFLRDWSPFILLLLGYMALTGVAGGLAAHAHVGFPLEADRLLFFGQVPTTVLQSSLWRPGHPHWYDYLATVLYPTHFVVPLVMAFAFWLFQKRLYWRFVVSYLLLTYSGFLTYVLFPAAPPWWAANEGRIPPVADILGEVRYGGVSNPIVLATKYFRPNAVAAMPSMHAAVPVLVWLVIWRIRPRWGWALVVYPLAMGFSLIYLGEHYFVDVLAGWLYALGAFAVVWGEWGGLKGTRPEAATGERAAYQDDSPLAALVRERARVAPESGQRARRRH